MSLPEPDDRASARTLLVLVLLGLVLRLALLASAEHALEADEATVASMALDVLEGRAHYFFFHKNAYNGGAALEAYLAAGGFAVLGPAAWVLKAVVLGLWLAAALLFADLCRRALSRPRAVVATFLFSLGTPFFLEWSLKARGGYAETVLVGVLLLWLGLPRARGAGLAALALGVASGVGLWASEMVLPLVGLAGLWLLAQRAPGERLRAGLLAGAGLALGLVPLAVYDLTHDFRFLKQSVVLGVVLPGGEGAEDHGGGPLTWEQMRVSLAFVLGPGWRLALVALLVATVRLVRGPRGLDLGRLLWLHVVLYVTAYWLAGLRSLPVPPARVLYALLPSLAVLGACAAAPTARTRGHAGVLTAGLALALWSALVLVPTARWARSGEPREAGSWRGAWALIDGPALRDFLLERDVDLAYGSYWTVWHLRWANAACMQGDPDAPELHPTYRVPRGAPPAGHRAAFVLHRHAPVLRVVEAALAAAGVPHERLEWNGLVILSGIPSDRVTRRIGLPDLLVHEAIPPVPETPDGFN